MPSSWLPLESNPDVMTKFIHESGAKGAAFCDIYGTDEGLLQMVPQPCYAVLLLFPSATQAEHKPAEAARIAKEGQEVSSNLYYMDQTIGNACGTIAMMHAIANNTDKITLEDGSYLGKFIEETRGLTSAERGAMLEKNEELTETHAESVKEGQTAAPTAEDRVDKHFIAFVQCDGHLYEMDGCKTAAINHGPTSDATFLSDAAKQCQQFIERGKGDVNFGMLALHGQ